MDLVILWVNGRHIWLFTSSQQSIYLNGGVSHSFCICAWKTKLSHFKIGRKIRIWQLVIAVGFFINSLQGYKIYKDFSSEKIDFPKKNTISAKHRFKNDQKVWRKYSCNKIIFKAFFWKEKCDVLFMTWSFSLLFSLIIHHKTIPSTHRPWTNNKDGISKFSRAYTY